MVSDITYKDKKKSGVYSISSLTDGRVYVGSAIDLYTRYMNHKKDLSKNSHCNKKLQNFYNKYGSQSLKITILEYCDKPDTIEREQHYIDKIKPYFNILGVARSWYGHKHTAESKKKMSNSKKGKIPLINMTPHSKETIEKIRVKAMGRPQNPNFREDSKSKVERQRKLNDNQIKEIRFLLTNNFTQVELAETFGVSQRLISRVKQNIGFYKDIELDKDYYKAAQNRIKEYRSQLKLSL